jgi:uncharacterized protein
MHPAPTALSCPKCNGTMRVYERSGVVVDQCDECRGIFLDRGELERLVDAESAFYQSADVRGYGHHGDGHYSDGHYRDSEYRDDVYRRGRQGGGPYRRRRKGGFLSELFD